MIDINRLLDETDELGTSFQPYQIIELDIDLLLDSQIYKVKSKSCN